MLATQNRLLFLNQSEGKGRGVFTSDSIPKGGLIEICPTIILSKEDTQGIHKTLLHDYYFLWNNDGQSAIALGYGSLYNHSETPNAIFELVYGDDEIHFIAQRDIEAGEEITINYLEIRDGKFELWF